MKILKYFVYSFMILTLLFLFGTLVYNSISDKNSYVINRIATKEKVVMLTFDDGPNKVNDKEIIDILESNGATGTFFFTGSNIKKYADENSEKELFKKIKESDMSVGNHSYSHSKYQNNKQKLIDEILETDNLIRENFELDQNYEIPMRMPYLQFYNGLKKVLETTKRTYFTGGYLSGDWDYEKHGHDKIIKRYLDNLKPGEIFIMHSTHYAKLFLNDLIKEIKNRGYEFANFNPSSKRYYKKFGELVW